jgi:glycosyl transferase family 25
MKAYCINLDRGADRLQHMAQQFHLQGMTFERIAAIDGTRPEIAAEAARVLPTALGPRISVAAYGCFQSHRQAWSRLLASGEPHGLVSEDDLVLAEGFSAYLKDDWVPPDADLVRLETFQTRTHVDARHDHAVGSRQLRRLRSSHLGAGCYVLSAKAAQRLHECTAVIRDPVDVVLFSETSDLFADLVTYQMIPAPAVQGKRHGPETGTASWSVSNIQERFDGEAPADALRAETSLGRVKRRLVEYLRARRLGTHYIVVPFG